MIRIPLLLPVLIVALATSAACDRNTEAYVEGEIPRAPDLARIFPESEGAGGPARPSMGAVAGGAALQPARRGAPPFTEPQALTPPQAPAAQQAAATPQAAGGDTITGTIQLAGGLSAPPQAMLFVIARPFGVKAGPPLAALRIPSPQFPLAFEIGPANVMIPSMRFEGDIGISARLDGDGNAMTRSPGDLQGSASKALQPGARGAQIVLDEKL